MQNNIFLPKKIKVGFQERKDTYTGRLAYIIYYDEKGVLRKEKSWKSWCRVEDTYYSDYVRDENGQAKKDENDQYLKEEKLRYKGLGSIDYNNVPTEGFVLNKNVGDHSSGWNHRMAKCRVYDPRGFEFEIEIENLLYILENTNSIKGKGLEGSFVYGWQGTNLILIPTESPDYKQLDDFNDVVHNAEKIGVRDLILGATYQSRDNHKYIYLGKFDYHEHDYNENIKKITKKFWFKTDNKNDTVMIQTGTSNLIKTISKEPVENYAQLMDELENDIRYSPLDKDAYEYSQLTLEEFQEKIKTYYQYFYVKVEDIWFTIRFYSGGNKKYQLSDMRRVNLAPEEDIKLVYNNSYIGYKDSKSEWKRSMYEKKVDSVLERIREELKTLSGTKEDIYSKIPIYSVTKYLENGRKYEK